MKSTVLSLPKKKELTMTKVHTQKRPYVPAHIKKDFRANTRSLRHGLEGRDRLRRLDLELTKTRTGILLRTQDFQFP